MPTAQMGAIRPQGVKKKKQLYAPMVQEAAKQGVATQMVMDRKNMEQQEESKAFQQEQFQQQKDQAAMQDQQWQKDYELQQQSQQQSFQQQQEMMAQKKKQDNFNMIAGGLSTAASIMGSFDIGWDTVSGWF